MFKLVLNCKYPLKNGNRFQPFPIWDDSSVYRMLNMVNTTGMKEIELYIEVVRVKPQVNQSMGGYIYLFVPENYNVAEFDYGCGPSSGLTPETDRCGVYANDEDCEYNEANVDSEKDVDDEKNGDLDVQADVHVSSFQTFNQVLENEQGIYVSAYAASCDVSNDNAFLTGTRLERVGFDGPVCSLWALDSSSKTRNQKDRRGSPIVSLMPKSVPSGERKDQLLRE